MGKRALPFMAASLPSMTPELCSRMAKTRFASAYGLEYGRECWLDPDNGTFADLTQYGPSNKCAMFCSGDPQATCGDECTVDLYTSDAVELNVTMPEAGVTNMGCYQDSENRTMPKWLWSSRAAMSVELCAHIAAAEAWPVFGLQYGMECWGGYDAQGVQVQGAADCNMACPGNTSQSCGGAWAMQVCVAALDF
ncbi:hypothetical protein OEZ86_008286 [Tetradesmus obliquus]|nr:hypothetical protein OEZ86_008286 [Tetradesmus obliquus]